MSAEQMSAARRSDNLPEALRAHDVRHLNRCILCNGLGDQRLMVNGDTHTACFAKWHGTSAVLALPVAELGKIRLCDIQLLPIEGRNQVLDAFRSMGAVARAIALAAEWRRQHDDRDPEFVRYYDDELAGWAMELGPARSWVAGTLSVDRNSDAWMASGGTADTGAAEWVRVFP